MNTYLDKLPSREERMAMLATLREASEGKIFLEREYAKCTRMQVEMLESEGKIDEAAKVIQEIAIETYGSVESKDKVDFILYQMKLVLARQDYIRTQILSRKITKRALAEAGLEPQKVNYYEFMVRYYVHEKEVMEVAKCYEIIFETINGANDELKKKLDATGEASKSAFRNFVLYLLISPQNQDKVDKLKEVEKKYPRELEAEELIARYVRKFLVFEIIPLNEEEV